MTYVWPTTWFRTAILSVCAPLALGFPALLQAQSTDVGSSPFVFSYYGQINLGLQNYNDGVQSYNHFLIDNANNDGGTFIGFSVLRPLSSGWNFEGVFELSLAPRPSNKTSQTDPDYSAYSFDQEAIRRLEVSLGNDRFGTFYLGQGEMSAAGSGPDFSGTGVISSRNPSQTAGGHFWRQTDDTLSTRTLSQVINDQNSGRRFRLRFDSRSFYGVSISTSIGREVLSSGDDSTYIDFVANYARSFGNFDVEVEFDATGLGNDEYALIGSAAMIHVPTGLNLTLSGSHSTLDPHYGYAKIGIIRDVFSFGSTALSIDHYNSGRFVVTESEAISWGLSIVQQVDDANMEIYASWRRYQAYNNFQIPAEQFQNAHAIIAGILWTF